MFQELVSCHIFSILDFFWHGNVFRCLLRDILSRFINKFPELTGIKISSNLVQNLSAMFDLKLSSNHSTSQICDREVWGRERSTLSFYFHTSSVLPQLETHPFCSRPTKESLATWPPTTASQARGESAVVFRRRKERMILLENQKSPPHRCYG